MHVHSLVLFSLSSSACLYMKISFIISLFGIVWVMYVKPPNLPFPFFTSLYIPGTVSSPYWLGFIRPLFFKWSINSCVNSIIIYN